MSAQDTEYDDSPKTHDDIMQEYMRLVDCYDAACWQDRAAVWRILNKYIGSVSS